MVRGRGKLERCSIEFLQGDVGGMRGLSYSDLIELLKRAKLKKLTRAKRRN